MENELKWMKKGQKYKAHYFCALKQLYGGITHDKDSQVGRITDRTAGADQICDVDKKNGL